MSIVGVASSSGIGGGGITMPAIMVFFGKSYVKTLGQTYIIMLAGGIGNAMYMIREIDPKTNLPIINYDFIILCIPMLIFGSIVGVKLGYMLPEVVTCSVLIIILLNILRTSYSK